VRDELQRKLYRDRAKGALEEAWHLSEGKDWDIAYQLAMTYGELGEVFFFLKKRTQSGWIFTYFSC